MGTTGFPSVSTRVQYGGTGSYQLNTTIAGIELRTDSSKYTITAPDAGGNGTFTPKAAGTFKLQASDGTVGYYSDEITCWANASASASNKSNTIRSDSGTVSGNTAAAMLRLTYDDGKKGANVSQFNIQYSLGTHDSAITAVSGYVQLGTAYAKITYSTGTYGTYRATINITVSAKSGTEYILSSTQVSAQFTLNVEDNTSPSVSYDVTPPSNFINQTYNIDASAVPITRTVTWTEGSSGYYYQGGTKSASAIGTYQITFTLTSPSSHRWTDRSSDNTKSFTWKVLDPYIGYSRPQISGEDYEAIIFENGEAKLVVFKVGDT